MATKLRIKAHWFKPDQAKSPEQTASAMEQLTATVRNRAPYAVAYPHLELTLTDAQDGVVVRRALAPAEYIGATLDPSKGISANGEVAVRVFIDFLAEKLPPLMEAARLQCSDKGCDGQGRKSGKG